MLDSDFNIHNFVNFRDEEEMDKVENACQHYKRKQKGMFDPFQLPADIRVAERYGRSCILANRFPEQSITQHLWTHPTEFVNMSLGAGMALFYVFRKRMILLLFTIFLSSGLYNIYTNGKGDYCETSKECANNWISAFSLGNLRNPNEGAFIRSLLNFTSILMLIILIQFIIRDQQNLEVECDEANPKIGDYTILIKNLPRDKTEAEIREDIENSLPTEVLSSVKVQDICFAYSVKKLLQNKKELKGGIHSIQKQVLANKLDEQEASHRIKTLKNSYNVKVDKIFTEIYINRESQIQYSFNFRGKPRVDRNQLSSSNFTGLAFVTLETEQQRNKIVEFYSKSLLQRIFSGERQKRLDSLNITYSNYFSDMKLNYLFMDCEIYNAPHPEEICWKSLGVNKWWKFSKRLITAFFTLICLSLITAVLWFVSYKLQWQPQIIKTFIIDLDSKNLTLTSSKAKSTTFEFFSICMAFLTTCALVVMGFIVRFMHRKNSYIVSTHQEHNIANTLTLVYFYISALLPLFLMFMKSKVHGIQDSIYSWGGLVQNQMYVFFSMSLLPPLSKILINFRYIFRLYKRFRAVRMSNPWKSMQYQVDHIFEGPEEDFPEQMAFTMKTVYFAVFYFPVLPFGMIISIFGLSLNYWVDKYLLLSRNFVKDHIGSAVSAQITTDANRIPAIFSLACIVFEYLISESFSTLNIITLVFGLVYSFMPLGMHKTLNVSLMRYSRRKPHPPFSSLMQKDSIISYKETFNRNFLIIGDQDEPTVSRLLLKQNNFTFIQPVPKIIKFSTDDEESLYGQTTTKDVNLKVKRERTNTLINPTVSDMDILQMDEDEMVMTQSNVNT